MKFEINCILGCINGKGRNMHEDKRTDEEIAASVQDGNTDEFGVLIERYRDKLLRYARRFLVDYDAIEDAVQDVFVKTFTNIQSFNPSMRFSPWIYRIAHNTYINVIKKTGREPITFFDPDTLLRHPASEKVDEAQMKKEDAELLNAHLQELDPKYREPIVLFYFEEKEYKEIADILRIPTSTVGVRIRRGREKIKSIISQKMES